MRHLIPYHLLYCCSDVYYCLYMHHTLEYVVVVVSHIQRIGCQPEKTTLHGGQSRSWSAEQGKENKRKSLAAYPPRRCFYNNSRWVGDHPVLVLYCTLYLIRYEVPYETPYTLPPPVLLQRCILLFVHASYSGVCCCCCFSHSAYWLPTRKNYFTRWPIPLVVC